MHTGLYPAAPTAHERPEPLPGIPRHLAPTDRVAEAYRRIALVDRPEVWITLRPEAEVMAEAAAIEVRLAAGEHLPLAGWLAAVKDNVDVAGLPTTAACPEFATTPDVTATAVARLVGAGVLVLGKANLDQFATGLVGTRSPYGAVRCAWGPSLIAGGSSSGSAVAVALGLVDLGVGTDTAGSGRVPAAFQGIVGLKATRGIVPTTGVVPACADYDCVSLFAADLETARAALGTMAGPDPADPRSRSWPADVRLAAPAVGRVAVPRPEDLSALSPGYADAFARAVEELAPQGFAVGTVDISGLLEAATLLYDGAIVAQRYAAVGDFLATRPAGADPIVSEVILASAALAAPDYVRDAARLLDARADAARLLEGYDALLLPTTTDHPALVDVEAEPVAVNRRLGTFTNFCNLLDMAAVAVPAGHARLPTAAGVGGGAGAWSPFGVVFLVPAFADQVALDLAARFTGAEPGPALPRGAVEVAVFGAHLRGQPLNAQLEALGARFAGEVRTSDAYRLVDLGTTPAKPGLVRHGPGLGAPIAGEVWCLSPAGLGTLLAGLPEPMSLTRVELEDGRSVVGFGCSFEAAIAGTDITGHGGWVAYRASLPGSPQPG